MPERMPGRGVELNAGGQALLGGVKPIDPPGGLWAARPPLGEAGLGPQPPFALSQPDAKAMIPGPVGQ